MNPTSGSISAICERYNGQILTAQWRHEIQLYQDAVGSLTLKDAIPFSPLVYAMAESPDSSKIWIASAQGLYWINTLTDKFSIHKDTIFSSRFLAANGLVFDDDNKMWVSTNKGLVQYSPEKAENADPDGPPPNVFRVFTVADGLPSNEFNFWSFTKTRNGELAFGTTNGYILFNPKDITEYPVEAKPTITQILVNNQEVKGREKFGKATYQGEEIEELILKPAERTFTFRFSAMDYGDPQATQFEYRLRKKNGDLINKGNERFVRYFNLEQGEYVFELYASNSENVWNETPRRLALRLKPYFYETPWFYALLAAVGLGIIYGIYRNRTEHLRKKQQLAELENAILRIQMNPHFIFNSLSSIQAYMLDKDTKVANKYLIHLSRLMRKILDIAEKPQISVGEDIELLTEYMEAEKLRFEQAFSYKIEKVGDMDEDEVMIPTMILQPFVENAIIHGFKKNSKEGVLTVRYRKDLKYLICEVRDNGIGRQASTREKKKGHNSKATVITNRRLALIQEKMGQPASLEILDLFD
ncbi:MAG: histidine kinase, partial [Bacteroidota bacterium]